MKPEHQWIEMIILMFLAIGFIFALAFNNSTLGLFVILVAGFLAARLHYYRVLNRKLLFRNQ